jgi:hypothetical protein
MKELLIEEPPSSVGEAVTTVVARSSSLPFPRAGIGTVLSEMVAKVSQGLFPPPFWMMFCALSWLFGPNLQSVSRLVLKEFDRDVKPYASP